MALAVLAAGLAALVNASPLWAEVTLTMAMGTLLLGVVGVIYRGGAARAFWVGLVLFEASYLVLAFPWFGRDFGRRLAPTSFLSYLHVKLRRVHVPTMDRKPDIQVWVRADGVLRVDGEAVDEDELMR